MRAPKRGTYLGLLSITSCFVMPPTPSPGLLARTHAGAWRLNGIVWSLLLVDALAVPAMWGSYAALVPLVVLLPMTGIGLGANLVLFCLKLFAGRFRQAGGYGVGFALLAVFFVWLYFFLRTMRIEKSW